MEASIPTARRILDRVVAGAVRLSDRYAPPTAVLRTKSVGIAALARARDVLATVEQQDPPRNISDAVLCVAICRGHGFPVPGLQLQCHPRSRTKREEALQTVWDGSLRAG